MGNFSKQYVLAAVKYAKKKVEINDYIQSKHWNKAKSL